jgi:hypothetical protein
MHSGPGRGGSGRYRLSITKPTLADLRMSLWELERRLLFLDATAMGMKVGIGFLEVLPEVISNA